MSLFFRLGKGIRFMLCAKCGKRPAVVFVSDNRPNGETKGYCLTCAKEMGIKPVNDLIKQMGISDEDLEAVQNQMSGFMNELAENGDISEMMESMGLAAPDDTQDGSEDNDGDK